jgi:hypothetical protein
VGAGVALEALAVLGPTMPATPDWDALTESLGFVATGTVMIFVLFGAPRSKAAEHQQPGELSGSAVA